MTINYAENGLVVAFILIGLFGNPIVFYILTKFIKQSIFRYFLVTEVIDSINLVVFCLSVIASNNDLKRKAITCKIFQYLEYVLYSYYPWISTVNSIDRSCAIKYKNIFKFRKKISFQIFAIVVVFIISMAT